MIELKFAGITSAGSAVSGGLTSKTVSDYRGTFIKYEIHNQNGSVEVDKPMVMIDDNAYSLEELGDMVDFYENAKELFIKKVEEKS